MINIGGVLPTRQTHLRTPRAKPSTPPIQFIKTKNYVIIKQMAKKLTPQSIKNLGVYGIIRRAEVDDTLIPDGAVVAVKNFHFDQKGVATVRPGITALGSTVLTGKPAVGLHNAQSSTAVAVFSNGGSSAIYTFDKSSTWNLSVSEGTASIRVRFVDFGSYTIALNFNYNTYTSMRVWSAGADGSTYWHTSGHSINPQNMWGYAPQYGEVYKSKVYLFGDTSKEGNPSRLYFSSVIDLQGSITFTPREDYVDINPGDGEGGTGLKRFALELLCFKPNYIYRFRTSGTDPDPLIKIGTRSNESIVEGKRGLYFHHDSGFYRYTGGYPEEISRAISDFIDAIPYSQYDDIIGWNDPDHIYWSVGNLTVPEVGGSTTWKNVVLRYTESSDVWTIYSYSSDIRAAVAYNSGSAISRVVGLDNGVVATHNSGTTDIGEPIHFLVRTKFYDFGYPINTKILQQIASLAEKAQGIGLMYQIDDEYNKWLPIGQQVNYATLYEDKNIRFNRIAFQFTGSSRKEASKVRSIEILDGLLEDLKR